MHLIPHRTTFHATVCALGFTFVAFTLAACAPIQEVMPIVREVSAVPAMRTDMVCVQTNQQVKETNFDEALATELEALGFKTRVKEGAFRGECPVWASYEASYAGFVPRWVASMRVTVYERSRLLGHVYYDASQASARMDKHGFAMSKLRPLLTELFASVERAPYSN